jgi:nucleoside-diphosphate-sugar epimerase
MSRVFVTGAGMVGCHVAGDLRAGGHDVVLFDSNPRDAYIAAVAGNVGVVRGDIRELPVLLAAVQDLRPDVVVHTVTLIGNVAQAEPYRGFEVNLVGTMNVVEAVRLAGRPRLVHASTLGVNDLSQPQLGPITESFPLGSVGRVYGASKVAQEQIVRAASLAYGFELAILRFGGIYGYGHFAGASGIGLQVDGWLRAAAAGRPGRYTGGLPDPYEIVYVKDVAVGVVKACLADRLPHDTYNVGSGVLVTPDDVIAAIARVVPGFQVEGATATRADPFPRRYPFDLSRSRDELGYEPRYSLDAGLADLLATIRADDQAQLDSGR